MCTSVLQCSVRRMCACSLDACPHRTVTVPHASLHPFLPSFLSVYRNCTPWVASPPLGWSQVASGIPGGAMLFLRLLHSNRSHPLSCFLSLWEKPNRQVANRHARGVRQAPGHVRARGYRPSASVRALQGAAPGRGCGGPAPRQVQVPWPPEDHCWEEVVRVPSLQ